MIQHERKKREKKFTRGYTVMFSEEQFNKLKLFCERTKLKPAAFIKQSIFNTRVTNPEPIEMLTREVNKCGVNLNQIARRVNAGEEAEHEVNALKTELTNLKDFLAGLLGEKK
jgi:hypothetical protein